MPNRFIKESCRSSKNLDRLSDFEERLFWRLITTADDYGRFLACPELVRSACFPLRTVSTERIETSLKSLQVNELIRIYSIDDRSYGVFCKWEKHQGKPRAKNSKYPEMIASAIGCEHLLADVPGGPNTNTDTDTNSDLNSILKVFNSISTGLQFDSSVDAGSFQDLWQRSLERYGWKVDRELPVQLPDGRYGRIDLRVASPVSIAIEIDWRTPRTKSYAKLGQYPSDFKIMILRDCPREAQWKAPEGIDAVIYCQPTESKQGKRGKREITEDDKPTQKHFELAKTLGVDVGPEWGKFKNYCKAHGVRYADFEAAFRNWLVKAVEMKEDKYALRRM